MCFRHKFQLLTALSSKHNTQLCALDTNFNSYPHFLQNTTHNPLYICIEYFTLYCICIFCRAERLPRGGGREHVLMAEQETAIVNMVLANNELTIKQIKSAIIDDRCCGFMLYV